MRGNQELKYTLREIAHWADVQKSKVRIPDLQRGLVWKPRQMELLWDSMLRGFPIGSFILSDATDESFFLMDGQQRFNAIATGFGVTGNHNAMLWLDIRPANTRNSTRVFWVKSTTRAHPWGFKNNDECTTLSAFERREALAKFNKPGLNIYCSRINLNETWPVEATKPVPLHFFLEAPLDSPDSFTHYLVNRCRETVCLPYSSLDSEDINVLKTELYSVFKDLEDYAVQCDVLARSVIERESQEKDETDEVTPLEVLFNRLNTGGTRISPDDLNYSAIKAYWSSIKERNDEIAKHYMAPSKLVMLAFRLALTRMDDSKGLHNPPSIRQIRGYAKDAAVKHQIELVYDRIENIMSRIDLWLDVYPDPDAMPAYIRTSIARNSPDDFLLLMYLASEDLDGKMAISPAEVKGLALMLHWMSQNKQKAAATIFNYVRNGGDSFSLRKGISECFGMNYLLPVFSSEEMRQFIRIAPDSKWNPWRGNDYAPWHDFYSRISFWRNAEAREMLLYAQRAFINKHFCLYDPAREDLWEEHNRPWDYDHIIPQNWIKQKGRQRRQFTEYCDHWVDRIGNIAAIPFEANRSKGDRESYTITIYEEYAEELLFSPEFLALSQNLPNNSEESILFAKITFNRTLEIYARCYGLFLPLIGETTLTDRQNKRRRMMESIASKLDGAELVYVARGGVLFREYPVLKDSDWSREWLSVGVRRNSKYFIAFTWGCNESDHLEIGVRKMPGTDALKDVSDLPVMDKSYWVGIGDWWYAEKPLSENIEEEIVLSELDALLMRFV